MQTPRAVARGVAEFALRRRCGAGGRIRKERVVRRNSGNASVDLHAESCRTH